MKTEGQRWIDTFYVTEVCERCGMPTTPSIICDNCSHSPNKKKRF
jgi:hypothetical protein